MRAKRENGSPAWLVKGDDSAGVNQLRQGSQGGNGIGKKLQNETSYRGIERFVSRKFAYIRLREGRVVQARLGHPNSGTGDRACIALYAHYFSRRADQPGSQNCHITNAGTKIQDTLAMSNVRLTEESLGERGQKHRLPNQALMFRIGIAQRVIRDATARLHMAPDITMLDFAPARRPHLGVTAALPFNRMRTYRRQLGDWRQNGLWDIRPVKSAWHHISSRTGVRQGWSVSGLPVTRLGRQRICSIISNGPSPQI
jgi:hypothetical protein